jgi:biotin carboxylase
LATIIFVETNRPGIQALQAAKDMGHRVVFVTSANCNWTYSADDWSEIRRLSDHVEEVENTQNADCLDAAITGQLRSGPVGAAITVLQWCAEPLAEAAARHGLPFTNPVGVRNARDKGRCRAILQDAQIKSVKHAVVRTHDEALEAAKAIGYPLIAKPATGVGKLLTAIVHSEAELSAHFNRTDDDAEALDALYKTEVVGDFILEELAIGPLYSVELGATAHGEWIPYVIMKRKLGRDNRILELGSTLPSDLSPEQHEQAATYAIDVCKALSLDIGIFHVEFIFTADGPRLVEVNPRIGGGAVASLIKTATGENIFPHLVNIHLGKRIGIETFSFKTAASHTFIAAGEHCTVPADIAPDWFETFKQGLSAGSVSIAPGDSLNKMSGNLDVRGVIQVTADDHESAIRKVNARQQEMEQVLRIPLMKCDSVRAQC